jgi:hypothetical protein
MIEDEIGHAEYEHPAPPRVAPSFARQPGALKGGIVIAEDFDTLPDEVATALEEWRQADGLMVEE